MTREINAQRSAVSCMSRSSILDSILCQIVHRNMNIIQANMYLSYKEKEDIVADIFLFIFSPFACFDVTKMNVTIC